MKKLLKYLFLFVLSFISNLFGWTVRVHNLADEAITLKIGTSQSYPCGHWYAACMDSWCDCGGNLNVAAKKTEEFNYNRPRTCSADYICAGACTTSLELVGKGVSTGVLGGLGACSDVEVYVVKDGSGKWRLSYSDWTDTFVGFLQKYIEPMVAGGLKLSTLLPAAEQAAKNGEEISTFINGLTKEIDVVASKANNIINHVNEEAKVINEFITRNGVKINDFKEKLPLILKGDIPGVLTLLDQINKLKTTFEEAQRLLESFKKTYDSLETQINNTSVVPLVQSAVNLLNVIKSLISNIKTVISAIPDWIISRNVVTPLQSAENNLNTLIKLLTDLTNEKYFTVQEIQKNILNGVISNLSTITTTFLTVKSSVDKLISEINKITGQHLSKLKNNIKVLSNLLSCGLDIEARVVKELQNPENIPVLIASAFGVVSGTIFSIGNLISLSPQFINSASFILQPLAPVIKKIVNPLLKDINLVGIANSVGEFVNSVKNSVDEVAQIIQTLDKNGIKIFPDNVNKIIGNLGQVTQNLTNDVSGIKKAVSSLAEELGGATTFGKLIANLNDYSATLNSLISDQRDNPELVKSLKDTASELKKIICSLIKEPTTRIEQFLQKLDNAVNSIVPKEGAKGTSRLIQELKNQLNEIRKTMASESSKVIDPLPDGSKKGKEKSGVIRADYGAGSQIKDVTNILKNFTKKGPFSFTGVMNNLFGDPAPHQKKRLNIEYVDENGNRKNVTIQEDSPFSLPAESADDYTITSATFGTKDRKIDVKWIVENMTRNKNYSFPGGPDSMIKIFSDPVPGAQKQLIIEYVDASGNKKSKTINENEPFSLP